MQACLTVLITHRHQLSGGRGTVKSSGRGVFSCFVLIKGVSVGSFSVYLNNYLGFSKMESKLCYTSLGHGSVIVESHLLISKESSAFIPGC